MSNYLVPGEIYGNSILTSNYGTFLNYTWWTGIYIKYIINLYLYTLVKIYRYIFNVYINCYDMMI